MNAAPLLTSTAVVISLFIISLTAVNAECPEPDIATYHTCLRGCPDTVAYPQKHADCSNICIASWGRIQDAYYACQKQEREAAAAKKAELAKSTSVSKLKGKLTVIRADGTQITAGVDTIIKDGDTIHTDEKTTATIRMPDGSIITLGPNSAIRYIDYFDGSIIERSVKRMRAWVKHNRNKFEVRTPPAVVAVRGTEFIIDYDPAKETTTVYLYEGIVDITNVNNETKELTTGNVMSVDMPGKFTTMKLNSTVWNEFKQSIANGEEYTPPEIVSTTGMPSDKASPGQESQEMPVGRGEVKSVLKDWLSKISVVSVVSVLAIVFGIIIIAKAFKKRKK